MRTSIFSFFDDPQIFLEFLAPWIFILIFTANSSLRKFILKNFSYLSTASSLLALQIYRRHKEIKYSKKFHLLTHASEREKIKMINSWRKLQYSFIYKILALCCQLI